jgi:hypothetical protein
VRAFLEKHVTGKWMYLLLFSRYCTQSLLEEAVKISYGGGSPPKTACSRSGHSLALWLALWGVTFLGRVRGGLEVGDGARTKFWHDIWCGVTALKEAFPVLFGIARANDAFVADNLELLGGSNQWSASFSREAHD